MASEKGKLVDVFTGMIEQRTPASAVQASTFHNIEVALDKLRREADNGDLTPRAKDAVDDLTRAFDGLSEAAATEVPVSPEVTEPAQSPTAPVVKDDGPVVKDGAAPSNTTSDSKTADAKTASRNNSSTGSRTGSKNTNSKN